jgi:hypothetical protein
MDLVAVDVCRASSSVLVLPQQLLHLVHLVLEALLLVRPRTDPDIALDPYNAILMQQRMALSDDLHHIVPGPFCSPSVVKQP